MENTDIIPQIYNVLEKRLCVDPKLLQVANNNCPLTGDPFWLSGISLTYLFFEIEQHFSITIEEANIVNYGFNTISQISSCVGRKLVK